MNLDERVYIHWAINTQTVLSRAVLRNIRQYIGATSSRIWDANIATVSFWSGAF